MESKSNRYELFVSYSENDDVQVQHLASDLRKRNIVVTALPFDLKRAPNIAEAIRVDTKRAKILAIALSQRALTTNWVKHDIQAQVMHPLRYTLASTYLLKLVDLSSRDIDALPYCANCRIVDLSAEHYETGIEEIVKLLGTITPPLSQRPSPKYYKISGIFQPSRPSTELFGELKREIKEGTIDQKYLYWDVRAALRWQRIVELSGYLTGQVSMNLLVVSAGDIVRTIAEDSKCRDFSFINLGVGTGVKDYQLLSHLLERSNKVCYFAIDESFPMIQLTMKTLEELLSAYPETLEAHYIVDDFMNLGEYGDYMKASEAPDSRRVIAFLGGSIGNFSERRILSTIRGLMTDKGYLILGVEYTAGRDDATLSRNYEDQRMREFLFGPIRDVEGTEPDWDKDFRYEVLLSDPRYTDVKNAKTIVGYVKHSRAGDVELFSSTKYDKASLDTFLTEVMHFNVVAAFTSPETPPRYGKYVLKSTH